MYLIVVAIILFFLGRAIFGGSSSGWNNLVATGTPARGIFLKVNSTAASLMRSGIRLEQRRARVDVEIPGQAPYEIDATVIYPVNMRADVMPGASVELRVDPNNRKRVIVVGPGSGFAMNALLAGSLQAPSDQSDDALKRSA